jgi:hypothetical protein
MSNLQEDLEKRVVAQAQNDVMARYGLSDEVNYLNGFSKTANYNDDIQELYNYAWNETLTKLANDGVIELENNSQQQEQGLSEEDIVNLIQHQAQADAYAAGGLSEEVDYFGQYGLSKNANWSDDCVAIYDSVYVDTANSIMKSASYDPYLEQARALVGSITKDLYHLNLKKEANLYEQHVVEYVKNR